MTINVTAYDGNSMESAISELLNSVSSKLNNTGKLISNTLVQTTRRHFLTIYPGSNHYSPNKVTQGNSTSNSGEADIDVPGVTRAYHDLDIKPRFRKWLTIPISSSSYGKKSSDFNNTFFVKTRDGKALIGQNNGNKVVWLYRLVKNVHQSRDTRLMPSDNTYAQNILARVSAYLRNN